jgi:hypothetical protein
MSFEVNSAEGHARTCDECTACCDGWLKINVYGTHVYPGMPCRHSSSHGCTIYDDRPRDPCREFICGWLTPTSPLPDWMRPDKAQVIMLPANFTWQGRPVDVAVAVREAITPRALEWLKGFSLSQKRMLLYQINDDWFAFGPPAFQREMRDRLRNGEKPWSPAL